MFDPGEKPGQQLTLCCDCSEKTWHAMDWPIAQDARKYVRLCAVCYSKRARERYHAEFVAGLKKNVKKVDAKNGAADTQYKLFG